MIDRESAALLWKLLQILIKQNGVTMHHHIIFISLKPLFYDWNKMFLECTRRTKKLYLKSVPS